MFIIFLGECLLIDRYVQFPEDFQVSLVPIALQLIPHTTGMIVKQTQHNELPSCSMSLLVVYCLCLVLWFPVLAHLSIICRAIVCVCVHIRRVNSVR